MQAVPLFKRRAKASNANGREQKGTAARRDKKIGQFLLYIKTKKKGEV